MIRRRPSRSRPRLVHLTTTDMSLDWLLGPQLQAFDEAGFEVIGMSAPGPHLDALRALGVRHVPIPSFTRSSDPLQDARAMGQLVGQLRTLRPDILHTHNPKPGILGRIAGRLTRVPLVINTQHGLYAQPDDPWKRRLPVYAAERLAASFSDVELVQNVEDVDTLVRRLRVADRKVRLLGNGIDLGRFDPATIDPDERARVRAEWGVDQSEVVCLVVGRLVQEKGVVELFTAARSLASSKVCARFVVVGPIDVDKSDAVDTSLVDDARRDGVIFTGLRTDLPQCYAAADIFVSASWREGMPRSAMEAAAMGLPTVATDIRGNRQVVVQGVTGLLVPVRDARDLAGAVGGLAADARLRRTFGHAARKHATVEFDQRRVIDRTLGAYGELGHSTSRLRRVLRGSSSGIPDANGE